MAEMKSILRKLLSTQTVRFGRVPKREKAKILAAMQASHINKTNELILNEGLNNINELKSVIINAHYSTCDFTKGKIENLIKEQSIASREKFEGGVRTASATTSFLTCPLNPINYSSADDIDDNFSDRFSPAIRGVVEFAKLLPGFNTLTQDDQIILLKNGVFEVLLLRLSNMFLSNNTMLCINGKVVNIINIDDDGTKANGSASSPAGAVNGGSSPNNGASANSAKFLIKSMFKFTTNFNQWNLDDDIIGVFSAIILMSWDRPGLRNPELIKKLQSHYRTVLHTLLPGEICNALESKIPDLRTLNTLHSEKLLSFKMDGIKCAGNKGKESQQQQQHYASDSSAMMEDDEASRETTSTSTSMSTGSPPSISGSGSGHGASSQPINISNHHGCPYAGMSGSASSTTIFPVSPSNDSGIESGACSSPSRSEVSETFYNEREKNEESMPVLKRALQAPPLVDNQYVPTNYYARDEENVRRSPEAERNYIYNIGHKKFRRSTITPPSDMTSNSSRTSTSSPPQNQPSTPATIPNQYNNQIKHETITTPTSTTSSTSTYDNQQPVKSKETTPVQLYPQLASALTRPLQNYSASSSHSHSHNHHSSVLSQALGHGQPHHSQNHNGVNMEMSTLKQSLLKPSMSPNTEETSNYIHSLIMRDEFGSPPPPPIRGTTISRVDTMASSAAAAAARSMQQEANQTPLNLCIKSTPPSTPRNGIVT